MQRSDGLFAVMELGPRTVDEWIFLDHIMVHFDAKTQIVATVSIPLRHRGEFVTGTDIELLKNVVSVVLNEAGAASRPRQGK